MKRIGHRHSWCIPAALLLVLLGMVSGQANEPEEYRVKGAFLYNFLKYVEWPNEQNPTDSDAFVIVVYGDDPFGAGLDQALAGRHVDTHPVTVRRVAAGDSLPECHLVFTTMDDEQQLRPLLEYAHAHGVLSVGEAEGFLALGGIIRLLIDDSRIRFDVNLHSAKLSDIVISSKMLNLARTVVRKG